MNFSSLKSPFVVFCFALVFLLDAFVERSFAQTTKIVPRADSTTAKEPAKSTAAATDSTVLSDESPSNVDDVLALKNGARFVGSVERISGRDGVSFRVFGESSTRTFATADVERVETTVGAEFQQGVSAFERGRRSGSEAEFRLALAAFQKARPTETRRWIREWATAKIVDSFVALGRTDDAANEFFVLARLDPYSAFLPSIPLRWTGRTSLRRAVATSNAASPAERAAADWLDPNNPTAAQNPTGRLLAASILLNSPERKNDAISALQALVVCAVPESETTATTGAAGETTASRDVDAAQTCRTISLLATAQLWRLSLLKTPTEREVARWEKTLALFPNELRLGPTFLVARADAALRRNDAARRAFLQVALLATADRELAEEGAKGAAESLDRAENRADSERLRADAAVRFAQ